MIFLRKYENILKRDRKKLLIPIFRGNITIPTKTTILLVSFFWNYYKKHKSENYITYLNTSTPHEMKNVKLNINIQTLKQIPANETTAF